MKPYYSSTETDPIARAAAEWVVRHDRGLTAVEQDAFSHWLAADPRHRAAWAAHRWGWDEFDRLAGLQTSVHAVPDPELLAPRRRPMRFLPPLLAMAAAVSVGLFVWVSRPRVVPVAPSVSRVVALIEQRELADGTTIELNRGAVVTEHFTAGERRVRLERGEANFKVAKDAARPFFVEAGGVAVRAVGTEFNVRLDPAAVEVLVTEGKVAVATSAGASFIADTSHSDGSSSVSPTFVIAGERTVVSLAPAAPAPQVTVVPPAEIEARLAWQPRMLDFTAAPLVEIVAEFNRRNPVRLSLDGSGLDQLRLSATFRSDNIEGFVRLMESDFGMRVERRHDDEIVLSRAP